MCSKPRRYLFIDLICYSCSDLLIAAFGVRVRLCYCCCPLAVCLDQLRLILPGVDWTLQMSAYNLLIPFISGCCCVCVCVRACLSKTDGGGWLCLRVGNESISFTPVSSPDGGREGASCCLSVSFLFLSPSVSSHMLVA